MPYRPTLSRLINDEQSVLETSLEAVILINGLTVGRANGIRVSMQTGARPVDELGSDRSVEAVQGIKKFNGTIQSMTIRYGDLTKRLASISGGKIDEQSKAATMSNMPTFDVAIMRRGTPQFNTPQLYAEVEGEQKLAGSENVIKVLRFCVITNADQNITVDNSIIMESVGIIYLDEAMGNFQSINNSSVVSVA